MNKQYNNRLKDIFRKLAFNKKKSIVGSAKSNLFFGDYDLNSVLNYRGKNAETKIYNEFKKIFNLLNPMITFGLLVVILDYVKCLKNTLVLRVVDLVGAV
jgi:DUF917 family protein